MDQAAYSFLVGSLGGAIGGVLSIAVAMWYVDFAHGRKKKDIQNPQTILNIPHCQKCNSPNLVKDEAGIYCGKCGASFLSMIEPSEPPQSQIGQSPQSPTQQSEAHSIEEVAQPQEEMPLRLVEKVFCCPFCKETKSTKQRLSYHIKHLHAEIMKGVTPIIVK